MAMTVVVEGKKKGRPKKQWMEKHRIVTRAGKEKSRVGMGVRNSYLLPAGTTCHVPKVQLLQESVVGTQCMLIQGCTQYFCFLH